MLLRRLPRPGRPRNSVRLKAEWQGSGNDFIWFGSEAFPPTPWTHAEALSAISPVSLKKHFSFIFSTIFPISYYFWYTKCTQNIHILRISRYKVYNVKVEKEEQLANLGILKSDVVDFWRYPSVNGIVGRAMVPASHYDWFEEGLQKLGIEVDIFVEDVYEWVESKLQYFLVSSLK